MSKNIVTTVLSPEAYLERETKLEERHEYENGKLIAMVGSSREHNLLVRNLTTLIWNHLRGLKEYEYTLLNYA
jgi:Uma2 family endonuclease